jgi:hypothetical protein
MSSFLNNLEDKLRVIEEEIQTLPGELDSAVGRLDRGKLRSVFLRLEQDCDRLYEKQFAAQRNSLLVFPFILFPDGINGPVYRRITSEDIAKWRQAYKTKLHVVMGKGRVEVIAVSELAREYKTTVPQVILAAQQQGYTVLGWDEYQNLLDGIGKLIGEDEQQDKAIEPLGDTAHVAIGIPVTATDSTQEVKILPKNSLL